MAAAEKVRYLKFDRGRYYYQRRVPRDFQDVIGDLPPENRSI